MQVSEDTFELGKAIGQLLRGDARGAKALLVWNPEQLAQRLEIERLGGHIDQLAKCRRMLTSEVRRKPRSPHW